VWCFLCGTDWIRLQRVNPAGTAWPRSFWCVLTPTQWTSRAVTLLSLPVSKSGVCRRKLHMSPPPTPYSSDTNYESKRFFQARQMHANPLNHARKSWEVTNTTQVFKCDFLIIRSLHDSLYDYGLDDRAIEDRSLAGARIFPLTSVSRPALVPTQPPVQWVSGSKASGAWRWQLTPSSAEVMNE